MTRMAFLRWHLDALLYFTLFSVLLASPGPFDWQGRDKYDMLNHMMDDVTEENCFAKSKDQITLPDGSVSQLPRANQLLTQIWFPNRSSLIHLHNMALNRAWFYSYIMQKLDTTEEFYLQPGLRYIYMSAEADVAANQPFINGSGVFFDKNVSYPNWYIDVPINQTLPLFGYRAWRADDYNEPSNWIRETTNNTFDIFDYAAGPGNDYTLSSYKFNPWYSLWLPDTDFSEQKRFPYEVGIRYSNGTGKYVTTDYKTRTIQGPPKPGNDPNSIIPVLFTQPWFDCGRSQKWIVTAVAPVYDFLARYHPWVHIKKYTRTAVVTMDIDFLAVDYNPCPTSLGNPEPNLLASTDECDRQTTMCEPQGGWNFRQKGNYWCWCKPGYRLPWWQFGSFHGIDILLSTDAEYRGGFKCEPVQLRYQLPNAEQGSDLGNQVAQQTGLQGRRKRSILDTVVSGFGQTRDLIIGGWQHVQRQVNNWQESIRRRRRSPNLISRKKRDSFDPEAMKNAQRILNKIADVYARRDQCRTIDPSMFQLPGDMAYGVNEQFEPQARTAVRLANFLSNFLQNVDYSEDLGLLRADKPINEEQLFAEIVANVMADSKILGSGVFYDQNKFLTYDNRTKTRVTREFFGGYAFTLSDDKGKKVNYRAIDLAGESGDNLYYNQDWFKKLKFRWAVNQYGLKRYTTRMWIRSDSRGESIAKYTHWPMWYRAADYTDGDWLVPKFQCDGLINNWVVTYVVPFFGLNDIRTDIEFKGVVTVDVDLMELYINQCPGDFFTPNAFKNTARCDYQTTYCRYYYLRKIKDAGYGNYQCHCKQGFEFPYTDNMYFYEGELIEKEYQKMLAGQRSRFTSFKCRLAAGTQLTASRFLSAFACLLCLIARLIAIPGSR